MEAKIMKWGNSLALRIPRSIAAEAGVEYGSSVDVRVEEGAIVARSADVPAIDLKKLLRKVTKANLHGEVSTGRRKGREVW
jgi:antitoxin MazE